MKRDNAFTGLEAAIVLIAFVVVAAVFSYVMLGAGFFATQKAQEVTYAGIKQATSNVVFEGHMYGNVTTDATTGKNSLNGFAFSIKVPGGGQNIDMSNTALVYTSTHMIPPRSVKPSVVNVALGKPNDIKYPNDPAGGCQVHTGDPIYNAYYPGANSILMPGASAIYTVCVGTIDANPTDPGHLAAGDWFSLEMIPQVGAPTLVTKRIDAGLQQGKPLL